MALHIALDAMGGDRGPEELVSGAVMAASESDLEISLIGDQVRLEAILATHGSSFLPDSSGACLPGCWHG